MNNNRLFQMPFSKIYALYSQKIGKKGRQQSELDAVIFWLTGYNPNTLQHVLDSDIPLKSFFEDSPNFNQNAKLITGLICGYRVENIEDPLLQKIRYLDKLVDELDKGRKLDTVLRK